MKRFCLITFALALSTSAASAGMTFNGVSLNGLSFNGLSFNGLSFNGLSFNGVGLDGTGPIDGSSHPTPINAEPSSDATPVVVQAVTLADGTRLTVVPGH